MDDRPSPEGKRDGARVAGWRLRGLVAGATRVYAVPAGSVRVGKSLDCDLVLPVDGVSAEHAILEARSAGILVRDAGSKNGTWLNDRAVGGRLAKAGDVIFFGPVELVVEEVREGDRRLELEFARESQATGSIAGDAGHGRLPTVSGFRLHDDDRWLRAAESFSAAIGDGTAAGRSSALAGLVADLSLAGVALFRCGDAQPMSITQLSGESGAVLAALDRAEAKVLTELAASAGRHGHPSLVAVGSGKVAMAPWTGQRAVGLVVAGRHAVELPDSLLRLLLRLTLPSAAGGASPADPAHGRGGERELIFPPGYVRGGSPAARRLEDDFRLAAAGRHPVLLVGETGVGKELAAWIVHRSSAVAEGPLVAVNCAALPADLLEAELFGVERGVATGVEPRQGLFQQAAGGSLVLDEIGELPAILQAKLLRALQNNEVRPLGGKPRRVDVRVLAATNRPQEDMVAAGDFRRDLYYRLAGDVIRIPPLRERREDIPELVAELGRREADAGGRAVAGVTVEAMRRLLAHDWPGNVRELEAEVRRAARRAPLGGAIDSSCLSAIFSKLGESGPLEAGAPPGSLASAVSRLEERLIRDALRAAGGVRSHAAKSLGISRNTLSAKIRRLRIDEASEAGG